MDLRGFIDDACHAHRSKCRGVECRTCGTVIARHLDLREAVAMTGLAVRGHVCPFPA
jgi:hypothetical protein